METILLHRDYIGYINPVNKMQNSVLFIEAPEVISIRFRV